MYAIVRSFPDNTQLRVLLETDELSEKGTCVEVYLNLSIGCDIQHGDYLEFDVNQLDIEQDIHNLTAGMSIKGTVSSTDAVDNRKIPVPSEFPWAWSNGKGLAYQVDKAISVATRIAEFWVTAHGWASDDVMELLEEARLDRQVSFVYTLVDCGQEWPVDSIDARLILGYVSLRSICEGALKLFLTVHYESYRQTAAILDRQGNLVNPAGIQFDKLIGTYVTHGNARYETYLRRIQQRGNGIHHFKDRDIGTQQELVRDVMTLNEFLREIDSTFPYPTSDWYDYVDWLKGGG